MKITEDPGTGLRDLTEEDSPAEDLIKEKEIGGADPDQDPPEEISAETILSQDSEERVLTKNTTKEIQGKIREETDRDLEIDKDPHQLETTPHHPRQEDPILHFPQKEIHHHSSESQDHKIMATIGDGPSPEVQQVETVLFPGETEIEEEIPGQEIIHRLTIKERIVLSTIKYPTAQPVGQILTPKIPVFVIPKLVK